MYLFFEDAGHGWLRVPRSELEDLGVAGEISTCSYQRLGYAYLEEDCDLGKFLRAKRVGGRRVIDWLSDWWPLNVKIKHSEKSAIRRYDHYVKQ
jgi:hypothetical protein